MRMSAKTDFEKNFYKLMNNAFYGKTIEDVLKYRNIKIKDDLERIHKNPRFLRDRIIGDNMVAVELFKEKVQFNKPIYIGYTVLELSKLSMYKFYYETLPKAFKTYEVLYIDTDSFILGIETEDMYEDLKKIENELDLSDMTDELDLPLKNNSINKKVIGKMKLEEGGRPIKLYAGVRSKCYDIQLEDKDNTITNKYKKQMDMIEMLYDNTVENVENYQNDILELNKRDIDKIISQYKELEIKKIKGVSKYIIARDFDIAKFVDCLVDGTIPRESEQYSIKVRDHRIHLQKTTKKAFGPFNDKHYITDDGINQVPYGLDNISYLNGMA